MAEQIASNPNGVPPEETQDHGCFDFLTKKEEKKTEDVVMTDLNANKNSKEEKHTLMDELRRTHSQSSCSSDEEVEHGGERKKKKGLKEEIKEKLSGKKEGEDGVPIGEGNAGTEQPEEKKGFLEKVKEKLPGQHKKGDEESQTPPTPPPLGDDMPRPIFFLGDSAADVGTNTYLNGSKLTANFPHNGIDFPNSQPTGRFSNGFNTADELAKLFRLKRSPPPFLSLLTLGFHQFKRHVFRGVNFASGGAGLLDATNWYMINQFTSLRGNFTAMIGVPKTEATLNKSLFFISIGSNDIFSYSPRTADEFISLLIAAYSKHITTLYELGAIISVPPVGCCPHSRLIQFNKNGTTGCYPPMNDLARAFHSALNTLLLKLTSQLPGMKYSLGNTYEMNYDAINNAKSYRFHDVESACCGHGNLNAQGPCNSTALSCPDRRKYLFWDMFHPTERASSIAAAALYLGPFYVSPLSFGQLGQNN